MYHRYYVYTGVYDRTFSRTRLVLYVTQYWVLHRSDDFYYSFSEWHGVQFNIAEWVARWTQFGFKFQRRFIIVFCSSYGNCINGVIDNNNNKQNYHIIREYYTQYNRWLLVFFSFFLLRLVTWNITNLLIIRYYAPNNKISEMHRCRSCS